MVKPIGILGGTFDPVHYGHLRPALEVLQNLELAEVRFIPCRLPPHRGQPAATPAQRLALLQRAVIDQPGFVVDDRELHRAGPSYTVDTLTALRAEVGAVPLCLLLGTDAFVSLPSWHRWQDILALTHVVVMHRPGTVPPWPEPLGRLVAGRMLQHPTALGASPAGGIWLQPVTQLAISATQIRQLLAHGYSPRYLLPEPVWTYLRDQNLYRSPSSLL